MKTKPNFKFLFILFLVTLLFYLPGILSPRDFWVEDEARYAEVLREMIQDGKWIVPHLNGSFYPDKPPVYFWMCAGLSILTGQITPLNCLIITGLTAMASVVAMYYLTRRLFDQKVAWVSSLIYMAMFLVFGCAQIVRMDTLLTFVIILSIYYFYLGYHDQKSYFYFLFYLVLFANVLIKGPIGVLIAILPIFVFLIQKKDWREFRNFVLHPGFFIFLALVIGWLGFIWISGNQDYIRNLFFKQIAGRAVNAFSHREPFYYYLLVFPLVILPWTGFLPGAIRQAWRNINDGVWLLFWWFIIGFVFISVISGKLAIYLLPLLPPMAILIGKYFSDLFENKINVGRTFSYEGIINSVLTFGLIIAIPFIVRRLPFSYQLNLMFVVPIFAFLFIIGVWFSLSRRVKATFFLFFLGTWLFSAIAFQHIIPVLNPAFSSRQVGDTLKTYVHQGYQIASFRVRTGILNFYFEGGIPEIETESLENYLTQPGAILILKNHELSKQPVFQKYPYKIFNHFEVANEKYVFIVLEG